jgi:iron complex transport system ATP-binding protein
MSGIAFDRVTAFAGGRRVIDDVRFEVRPGELVTLLGPNGAGKTTLLRAALGLVRPSSGRVLVGGIDTRELSPRARAGRIAWLPQHTPPTTQRVIDVVEAGRFRFSESSAETRTAAERALERFGIGALAERALERLSGGERQRVAFATLVAQQAECVLLDEPANHLDPAQQLESTSFIRELWKAGSAVLLVSHDVNLPGLLDPAFASRVVGLRAGRVEFVESTGAAGLAERFSELYQVRFRLLEAEGRRVLVAEGGALA